MRSENQLYGECTTFQIEKSKTRTCTKGANWIDDLRDAGEANIDNDSGVMTNCHCRDHGFKRRTTIPRRVRLVDITLIRSSLSFRTKTPSSMAKMMLVSLRAVTRAMGAMVKAQMTMA